MEISTSWLLIALAIQRSEWKIDGPPQIELESRHFQESWCRSCGGTGNPELNRFFRAIAAGTVQVQPEPTTASELTQFLEERPFVTLNSRSPWNLVFPWNDPLLAAGFALLCDFSTEEAWVIFELDSAHSPSAPRWVVCPTDPGLARVHGLKTN